MMIHWYSFSNLMTISGRPLLARRSTVNGDTLEYAYNLRARTLSARQVLDLDSSYSSMHFYAYYLVLSMHKQYAYAHTSQSSTTSTTPVVVQYSYSMDTSQQYSTSTTRVFTLYTYYICILLVASKQQYAPIVLCRATSQSTLELVVLLQVSCYAYTSCTSSYGKLVLWILPRLVVCKELVCNVRARTTS